MSIIVDRATPDLIVVPNRGLSIAGAHLTPAQAELCRADWSNYANTAPAPEAVEVWTIALSNPANDGNGTVHAAMTIPAPAGRHAEPVAP